MKILIVATCALALSGCVVPGGLSDPDVVGSIAGEARPHARMAPEAGEIVGMEQPGPTTCTIKGETVTCS